MFSQTYQFLDLMFAASRQNLLTIAHQVSHDDITIIASTHQDLTALFNNDCIARLFMLLHDIPTAALRIFGCILIVNEHLRIFRDTNQPTRVLRTFFVEIVRLGGPMTKSCDKTVMLLERFHPRAIFYIYCEDLAFTVAHKQLALSAV
jgi:hypothetical protein